jgi:subfamily B ATP-binding cassette protein MsbA
VKTYFRLLSFARPYSRFVTPYVLLVIPAVLFGALNFSLVIPLLDVLFNTRAGDTVAEMPAFSLSFDYVRSLFAYGSAYFAKTAGKEGALIFICSLILVSVFLANFFRYFSQRVLTRMRTWVVYRMRRAVFDKISTFHLGFFHKTQKGDLMSVVSNDLNEIENSVVSTVQVIFREPLVILVYFIILFSLSVKLTLMTILLFPVSGLVITSISKKLRRSADISQGILGRLLSIAEETISGIRIVKGFNAEKFVQGTFDEYNERHRKLSKSIINRRELASPVSEFLGVTVVTAVLLYGGNMVLNQGSGLTASAFITYIVLYSQILPPAKNISSAITNIQKGLASGDRVLRILDTPVDVVDTEGSIPVDRFSDAIEYKNVSFAYGEEPVLKNISFTLQKGRTVALVGQSGSGKSTLADLLPRFYDVSGGGIFIDGKNLRDIRSASLRGLMGIVTQEAILFNDTVFNNIAFGMTNVSEEDVIRAARIANAHDFILEMPEGYQTNIGDRGSRMSGGQRQRLSIARAVLRNPPILILDEATSSLDTESERLVQEAITNMMKNRTTLVIAHRLSTIQHADDILVLQKGEIIEHGRHDELLAQGGIYRKLYDLQSFV